MRASQNVIRVTTPSEDWLNRPSSTGPRPQRNTGAASAPGKRAWPVSTTSPVGRTTSSAQTCWKMSAWGPRPSPRSSALPTRLASGEPPMVVMNVEEFFSRSHACACRNVTPGSTVRYASCSSCSTMRSIRPRSSSTLPSPAGTREP
ncbi:hypothetical protein COSO111634_24390 [Corallococcus soli]